MTFRGTAVALSVVVLSLLAGCGDETPSASPSAVETPTPTPSPTPSASPPPDLTDELIAKHHVDGTRWVYEGDVVTFPDGSTGELVRFDGAPFLNVDIDGVTLVGEVPDHRASLGLSSAALQLDSGGVGYVVHQGGGESSVLNVMVVHGDELVSAGQACYDTEAYEYTRC
jgi:hypothetical protein